jgi:tetratricopeptide (TPR) repeat protein
MAVMKYVLCIAIAFLGGYSPVFATPAKPTIVMNGKVIGGDKSPSMIISDDQKYMFEASKKFMDMDFKGAEALYSRAIDANEGNANAWLQRGVVRRELGDVRGMASDAQRALIITEAAMRQNPNDADLYYQKSLAERLLKRFDVAEQDLRQAMRLSNSRKWETDLKAIALERKMAQ